MAKKRIISSCMIGAVILWLLAFGTDFLRASGGQIPIFCIETQEHHYTGLGYAFDLYPHPITGKTEYAVYVFGEMAGSNFTN